MKITLNKKKFEVSPAPYEAEWNIIASGVWEKETFLILDHFVEREATVLDIGSWAGAVTLYAAHLAKKIYAIDPDPVIFSALQKNISLNAALKEKIKCRNIAISDRDGTATLYARNEYGRSSSGLLSRARDTRSDVRVNCMTLREFIALEKINKIDFIKLDIEGGEFILFPTLGALLEELNFPTVYVSFHYNYLREHHYQNKFASFPRSIALFTSRALMKLETWFGFDLFRKANKKTVRDCMIPFKKYNYIYTELGKAISYSELKKDPLLIRKNNFVFTNKEWKTK